MEKIEFLGEDLLKEPESRILATGKEILVFRIKRSEKVGKLNSGDKFIHNNILYKIMNRERMHSKTEYFKFNCVIQTDVIHTKP